MSAEAFLIFQMLVILYALTDSFLLLRKGHQSIRLVLFGFAVSCTFLSDAYWLIYDFMYADEPMPFAANEIAEWSMFLLLGASLTTGLVRQRISVWKELAGTLLFVAGNTAVWILASGEWVQDILTGITLGYLMCCIVIRMKYSGVYSHIYWLIYGAGCTIVIATQMVCTFAPEPINEYAEYGCYAVLLTGAVLLLVRTVGSLMRDTKTDRGVCAAYSLFAWVLISLYLSSNFVVYVIFFALTSVNILLTYCSLKKEVLRV